MLGQIISGFGRLGQVRPCYIMLVQVISG